MASKPKIKLKTITYYIKNSKQIKIFDEMTKYSKYIYNSSMYCYSIYKLFENEIYEDLFIFIKHSKLVNKEKVKNYTINEETGEKNIFRRTKQNRDINSAKAEIELYNIFDKYYKFYKENKEIYSTNNVYIYNYIKKFLKNRYVTNDNLEKYRKLLKWIMSNDVNVQHNNTNINFVVYKIIDVILNSCYNKNYFRTKNELLHKKPISFANKTEIIIKNNQPVVLTIKKEFDMDDLIFIDDVRQEQYLLDKANQIIFKKLIIDKQNIDLSSENNIFGRIVYRHLGDNAYKLPADLISNIINKAYTNIKSYYGLKATGAKCNLSKYLGKDDKFNLFYYCRSFKMFGNKIRLTVGENISKNYKTLVDKEIKYFEENNYYHSNFVHKEEQLNDIQISENEYINKKHLINTTYTYLHIPTKLKLRKAIKTIKARTKKKITLIEIIPINGKYKICMTYQFAKEEKKTTKTKKIVKPLIELINESVSIDLGVKNLMTIYDPTGKQYIISGRILVSINEFYNKKISELQSILKKINKRNISKQIYNLLIERDNKINAHINKIISKLLETYGHKKRIIIGYNENWKQCVNMGHNNNRKFYAIPYKRILKKLFQKMEEYNKECIEVEESYTSKCDSLMLEVIGKKSQYSGKRIHRGLFLSGNGKVINADLNGAINIMRKYYTKIKTITGEKIYNPKKLEI